MNPQDYRSRILLAVCGLSPQIVTETLYALAVDRATPFVPTEVHLLTTAEGANRARLSLFGNSGWFPRFCREYNLRDIAFRDSHIHTLTNSSGFPLPDIRTVDENHAAADAITAWVRRLTANDHAAVHVSIAGGRKTMGFYAGYALSLYGRPQDRLSHVLVPAPFESHPEFFYPTRQQTVIYSPPPDSRPLDTSAAEVILAEIPFVRLRKWLPQDALHDPLGFRHAVDAAVSGLLALVFLPGECSVRCGGVEVRLPPAEWAFLSWLARRRVLDRGAVACPSEGAPEPSLAHEFLAEYRLTPAGQKTGERTVLALRKGMEKSFFLERKARLRKALTLALQHQAAPYLPVSTGPRGYSTWSLALDPRSIEWSTARNNSE